MQGLLVFIGIALVIAGLNDSRPLANRHFARDRRLFAVCSDHLKLGALTEG